jgi:hypothetical protein
VPDITGMVLNEKTGTGRTVGRDKFSRVGGAYVWSARPAYGIKKEYGEHIRTAKFPFEARDILNRSRQFM